MNLHYRFAPGQSIIIRATGIRGHVIARAQHSGAREVIYEIRYWDADEQVVERWLRDGKLAYRDYSVWLRELARRRNRRQ